LIGKSQCFPLYYYEARAKAAPSLFDAANENEYIRRDGVSDFILAQARSRYGERVTKEDIFYYVYGFLHSPDYRTRFSSDLKKMLPRLPLVEVPKDFWAFSKAGRDLAKLHLEYDNFAIAPSAEAIGVTVRGAESGHFRVEKMRFPSKDDKSTILFNSQIAVEHIPAQAYEYQVNGKSAIEWVMERYAVTTHKDSGIKNDPNDWAAEVGNERYILDLLLSVIRLSVETVEIVRGLPRAGFGEVEVVSPI
jgi:predicted helicase